MIEVNNTHKKLLKLAEKGRLLDENFKIAKKLEVDVKTDEDIFIIVQLLILNKGKCKVVLEYEDD